MQEWFQSLLGQDIGLVVSILVKIVIILVPLILTVAYLTYFERKVIGYMQLRVGPNVTGPWGLIAGHLRPLARCDAGIPGLPGPTIVCVR